jgi:hypothetical protein
MAYQYTDTEDEVVARLVAVLPTGYVVAAMPEKQSQFPLGGEKVMVIVAFSESSFEGTDSMDLIVQKENISILVNIRSAKLRGAFSINQALQLIKVILVGFKPSNLSKLSLQKIEFDDRNNEENYFSYNINFKANKMNIEVPEEEILPTLTKLTINYPEGEQLLEINSTL